MRFNFFYTSQKEFPLQSISEKKNKAFNLKIFSQLLVYQYQYIHNLNR